MTPRERDIGVLIVAFCLAAGGLGVLLGFILKGVAG